MASVKIVLFTSKTYSNGEHPVMLRITKDRKVKYINLSFKCQKKDWDKSICQFKRSHRNHHKRNLLLSGFKTKAMKIIDDFYIEGEEFTFKDFEAQFFETKITKKLTLMEAFEEKIENLKLSGKIGNARVYNETKKSFFKFCKDIHTRFRDLDYKMLEKYEVYLRSRGGTSGGIGIKMRTIRALYNDGIKKGYARQEDYPFKSYEVGKLKSNGIKRALTREEVRRIEELDVEQYPHLRNARNYFVFSYFTRGMNFIDILQLKWVDIFDGRISYVRSKTGRPFIVKILPPVQKILDCYRNLPSNTKYIFPILLKDGLSPSQIEDRKKKTLSRYNRNLKEIAKIVGIQKSLSSYVARHSYATNLKHAGVSISIISESLGHANLEVTETYLKAFENEVIDEATKRLLL